MTRHSIHDVQHPTAENPDDGIVARAIDLTKVYGSKDNEVMALDHVNVEFKRGEMTAIMGPSGSGKSTLMHCMAGLDAPSSGKVMVEGLEVSSMNQKQLTDLRREQIGFIFQSAVADSETSDRPRLVQPSGQGGRSGEAAHAPSKPAVRRPAAARGLRPRHHGTTVRDLRRRADRQPRLAFQP